MTITADDITRLTSTGKTTTEAAAALGVTRQHANRVLAAAGLSKPAGRPVTRPACVNDPAWLWAPNRTVTNLATEAGVSKRTIERARTKHPNPRQND